MVCEQLQGSVLVHFLQIVNTPGFLLCIPLTAIGVVPRTGSNADLFDWMILGTLLQWTIIGCICGVIGHRRARRET